MAKKQTGWKTKGMNRDLSVSAFNPEFSFENMNLRLSTNDGNTLLSWVNEKGPSEIYVTITTNPWSSRTSRIHYILGTPIGTAIIDSNLVLFTTNGKVIYNSGEDPIEIWHNDFIYSFRYSGTESNTVYLTGEILYNGNLNFSAKNPLETFVSYEADHIKKVYWTDGLNQPRVINIAADKDKLRLWSSADGINVDTFFDFVPAVTLKEQVDIVKNPSGGGTFAPGVIQYCATYINKYGLQSNIVYISPLFYLAYGDRGANPEEKVGNTFNITIKGADYNFDYIRLYSIQRTSIDATPIVKALSDLPINRYLNQLQEEGRSDRWQTDTIVFTDNGTIGYSVDPMELLYIGGKDITILTMIDKDNTLFMGNITLKMPLIDSLQDYFDTDREVLNHNWAIEYSRDEKSLVLNHTTGIYEHTNTLNKSSKEITTFKGNEWYRFGFQLQKKTGEWTDPVFLEDAKNTLYPNTSVFSDTVNLISAKSTIDFSVISNFDFSQFNKIRPVIVYPTITDRESLCQGVLNPTVFNALDRLTNSPFALASWFFRPYMPNVASGQQVNVSTSSVPVTINIKNNVTNPDTSVDFEFSLLTRNVYMFVGLLKSDITAALVVSEGLKYQIVGISPEQSITVLGYIGELSIPGYTRMYAFAVAYMIPKIPEGAGNPTVEFTQFTNNYWYDNTIYKIYKDLETDSGEFLYRAQYTPNTYTFRFCDVIENGIATHYYTVSFNSIGTSDYIPSSGNSTGSALTYKHYDSLPSLLTYNNGNWENITTGELDVEIQGSIPSYSSPFDTVSPAPISSVRDASNTQFFIDLSIVTLNSPDIEFDSLVLTYGSEGLKLRIVGAIPITANVSAHSIATSSSMLETSNIYTKEVSVIFGSTTVEIPMDTDPSFGSGETNKNIIHKNIDIYAGKRLVSDYFWNDVLVKKDGTENEKIKTSNLKYDFLIHPWHRAGSLNNDSRPIDSASSLLRTKKESHLLYSGNTEFFNLPYSFSSYVNTLFILTENAEVINYRLPRLRLEEVEDSGITYKPTSEINYYPNIDKILYNKKGYKPISSYTGSGESITLIDMYTPISMKYKSTSHAVIALNTNSNSISIPILPYGSWNSGVDKIGNYTAANSVLTFWGDDMKFYQDELALDNLFMLGATHVPLNYLWIGELYREGDNATRFGGKTKEAVKNNIWCIGGDTVDLNINGTTLNWTIGDTYYQRYDCLKTYPFTKEDPNQLVEILSFMCETRINIDGRYDRNRGLADNTNMSPTNFNLLNPVYSQKDNFFVVRNQHTDDQDKLVYPNQIFYTKTKESGADVDLWTNVSLASMLELDGDKGSINKLTRLNDSIIAFLDTGISQVLFDENVALSVQNGVPIEIANSGKVLGKRYLSNSIGCSNKWSVVKTPTGIYFMDSNDKSIYLFNGLLTNLSIQGGMNSWCKSNIDNTIWNPYEFSSFVSYYDRLNLDVLFINDNTALAWSEKLGSFTSFYDYGNIPYFENLDDLSIWAKPVSIIENEGTEEEVTIQGTSLYAHNQGDYCDFFGEKKPYWMTLIGNPEPLIDKIFTNLEFRACIDGDGILNQETNTFTPSRPFDSLETWNEYLHGITSLENRNGHNAFIHGGNISSLKRKFRIWRCDIPRDNWPVCLMPAPLPSNPTSELVEIYKTEMQAYINEKDKGISRYSRHSLDRIRNPWAYFKLTKNSMNDMPKVEIHDLTLTYFS